MFLSLVFGMSIRWLLTHFGKPLGKPLGSAVVRAPAFPNPQQPRRV